MQKCRAGIPTLYFIILPFANRMFVGSVFLVAPPSPLGGVFAGNADLPIGSSGISGKAQPEIGDGGTERNRKSQSGDWRSQAAMAAIQPKGAESFFLPDARPAKHLRPARISCGIFLQ
jgi:hypothetical protein